ncbi:MAG TPA: DUF885 domain-containing protein, partial [Nakamurella sp.]
STYVEGDRLLRPWLEARQAGQSAMDRFRRLLDEPLTPRVIRSELGADESADELRTNERDVPLHAPLT